MLGVAQESRHWDDILKLNYLLLADKGHKMAEQLLKFSAVVNKDAYSGWSKCIAGTMYQISETWRRNSSHNENWIECSLLTPVTLGKKLTQSWKCQSTILKVADTPWKVNFCQGQGLVWKRMGSRAWMKITFQQECWNPRVLQALWGYRSGMFLYIKG